VFFPVLSKHHARTEFGRSQSSRTCFSCTGRHGCRTLRIPATAGGAALHPGRPADSPAAVADRALFVAEIAAGTAGAGSGLAFGCRIRHLPASTCPNVRGVVPTVSRRDWHLWVLALIYISYYGDGMNSSARKGKMMATANISSEKDSIFDLWADPAILENCFSPVRSAYRGTRDDLERLTPRHGGGVWMGRGGGVG